MAKFTYRMQSILNIQYQLETQAKMELGRAQMKLMEEEEKLQRLIDRKEAYLEEGRRMRSDVLHVGDLKDNRNAMLIMDEMIEAQRGQVAQAQKVVEAARLRLQEVMQERKMHERLKEKALEQFMREENAAEGKAVDELTSYTYGQRGKGE
ncbi:MAG: flagellar export protein FliJ [Lachnospiraceae bacterium]|nr:flagellar export protein FliJ [Lachnospiraceae bacterium]